MTIYSPSRGGTETFLECPRKYQYSLRWEVPDRWRPELWMGAEVHRRLAQHYGAVVPLETVWLGETGQTLESAEAHVTKMVRAALALDIAKGARVLAVEQALGPEQCHPDLVLAWPDDTLSVVDWKFIYSCPAPYVERRLREYTSARSWQLWHYTWRANQQWLLPVREWSVVVMIATPTVRVRVVNMAVTPEFLRRWGTEAFKVWARMDAGDDYPRFDACLKYGGCPYYAGCWMLGADESKFDTVYRRIPSPAGGAA